MSGAGRPFVLLATRAQDRAADEEYDAILRFTGLTPDRLHRHRLEREPLDLDPGAVAGVIVGGSPFTSSDPEPAKSDVQRRVERELACLVAEICARDLPFLGACYGIGTLALHLGGSVDGTYAEPIGPSRVTLTPEGRADPLLADLPGAFDAFVGHKEAVRSVPPGAVLLATSAACPVQMLRYGRNVYATQFHPELDVPGIVTRIEIYRDFGYYHPAEADAVIARARDAVVVHPPGILRAFAERYG